MLTATLMSRNFLQDSIYKYCNTTSRQDESHRSKEGNTSIYKACNSTKRWTRFLSQPQKPELDNPYKGNNHRGKI